MQYGFSYALCECQCSSRADHADFDDRSGGEAVPNSWTVGGERQAVQPQRAFRPSARKRTSGFRALAAPMGPFERQFEDSTPPQCGIPKT